MILVINMVKKIMEQVSREREPQEKPVYSDRYSKSSNKLSGDNTNSEWEDVNHNCPMELEIHSHPSNSCSPPSESM